jgi:RNA polymerase sigma-70 factor (ECF subfamily)
MTNSIEEISEKDLLGLAMQGDKEAYGQLYQLYLDQVYRYVYFKVGNKEDAEDITENVFVRTWTAIHNKKGQIVIENFRAWIYRAAHNLVIDHYRKKGSKQEQEAGEDLTSTEEPVEAIVEKDFENKALYDVIQKLDERMQQVIILRFLNGHSHAETARIIGIKPGHVRVLQYRALKQLQELFAERDK